METGVQVGEEGQVLGIGKSGYGRQAGGSGGI